MERHEYEDPNVKSLMNSRSATTDQMMKGRLMTDTSPSVPATTVITDKIVL